MKVGDRVRMRSARPGQRLDKKVGTIIDIQGESILIQYPDIGGTFTFCKKLAVVDEASELEVLTRASKTKI